MSIATLGPTQPPFQWEPGVKRLGREADHSPLCSAEVKNARSYTSGSQYVFVAWFLVKHRDNTHAKMNFPSAKWTQKLIHFGMEGKFIFAANKKIYRQGCQLHHVKTMLHFLVKLSCTYRGVATVTAEPGPFNILCQQ
jgi:hypothetical protein